MNITAVEGFEAVPGENARYTQGEVVLRNHGFESAYPGAVLAPNWEGTGVSKTSTFVEREPVAPVENFKSVDKSLSERQLEEVFAVDWEQLSLDDPTT